MYGLNLDVIRFGLFFGLQASLGQTRCCRFISRCRFGRCPGQIPFRRAAISAVLSAAVFCVSADLPIDPLLRRFRLKDHFHNRINRTDIPTPKDRHNQRTDDRANEGEAIPDRHAYDFDRNSWCVVHPWSLCNFLTGGDSPIIACAIIAEQIPRTLFSKYGQYVQERIGNKAEMSYLYCPFIPYHRWGIG